MASLNVPIPGSVHRLVTDLHPKLTVFDRIRDRPTLVCKRFDGVNESHQYDALGHRLRSALADAPAVEARITGVDAFERPPRGSAPVVYLVVESPGLVSIHDRLTDAFGVVDGLEGADYVPHVTLARGGSMADARRLAETPVDPVTWTISRLDLWNPRYREAVGSFSLPA